MPVGRKSFRLRRDGRLKACMRSGSCWPLPLHTDHHEYRRKPPFSHSPGTLLHIISNKCLNKKREDYYYPLRFNFYRSEKEDSTMIAKSQQICNCYLHNKRKEQFLISNQSGSFYHRKKRVVSFSSY